MSKSVISGCLTDYRRGGEVIIEALRVGSMAGTPAHDGNVDTSTMSRCTAEEREGRWRDTVSDPIPLGPGR